MQLAYKVLCKCTFIVSPWHPRPDCTPEVSHIDKLRRYHCSLMHECTIQYGRAHYCIHGKLPVLDTSIDKDIETVTSFPVNVVKCVRHCDHYLWSLLPSVEATRNTCVFDIWSPEASQHFPASRSSFWVPSAKKNGACKEKEKGRKKSP